MAEPDSAHGERKSTRERTITRHRALQIGGILLVVFLVLLGWQLYSNYQVGQERDELERELTFQRMASDLALASIEASYGSYEGARELTSSFYTRLQANIQRAPVEGRSDMNALLDRRDAVITALSRRDPESPEILARMLFQYRGAIGEPERAEFMPTPGRVPARPEPADTTPPDTLEGTPDSMTG